MSTPFSITLNKVPGLRFIAETLQLQSSIGRNHLMKQKLMTNVKEITKQLDKVENFQLLIMQGSNANHLNSLKHSLSELRDIQGTLNALHSGMTLDDIGLFEIKRFALIADRLSEILKELKSNAVDFADMSQVIAILDPEKQRVAHFYIYDTYSEELTKLRQEYNALTRETLNNDYTDDPKGKRKSTDLQKVEELRLRCIAVEDDIRKIISARLRGYSVILMENLLSAAELDVWLSKAYLAVELNLNKPLIGIAESDTSIKGDSQPTAHHVYIRYKALFNPAVRHILEEKGKTFQPVDITITEAPIMITGANMAGKTVVLKTVALAQYLFQYGFFVPADEAVIVPVEKIMLSTEDEQSELKGLSSFAAEMLHINSIVKAAREGNKMLALVDEPARTTNPLEGEAIVGALLELLMKYKVPSLVTTHYTVESARCRCLRVTGLKTDLISADHGIENIQDYMDYSLVEADTSEGSTSVVPHEALTVAEILHIDKELLNIAARKLGQ